MVKSKNMEVDILAIGAHPDDIELSASGTILKHIAAGKKVAILDLTAGELGTRGSAEIRKEEAQKASKLLGIEKRVTLDMSDGFFELSKANKLKIIEQIRYFKPKHLLVNAPSDRHPDHGRANTLVREASFLAGLPKIESTFNGQLQEAFRPTAVYSYIQDRWIEPTFVVDISDHVDEKIEVIKAFKSQFFDPKSSEPETPISGEDFFEFLKGRWAQFGRLIGTQYGEGFVAERPLGVGDVTELF